ncbi:MAG: hypothetical protein ABIS18_01825 [Actinomycetota bacterium]
MNKIRNEGKYRLLPSILTVALTSFVFWDRNRGPASWVALAACLVILATIQISFSRLQNKVNKAS